MKFSIIVLGYNQSAVICDTLRTALSQTYENIEVIYVDDCSTDGSAARVAAEIRDPRLKIVAHAENSGPFIGRLNGIRAATGDRVLFLDGDDSLAPETCALLEQILRKDPDLDLIGFGTQLVQDGPVDSDTLAIMERSFGLPLQGDLTAEALRRSIFLDRAMGFNLWNKCYAMDTAKAVAAAAAEDKLYYNEDFYFTFMACSLAKRYRGIPHRLYRYRVGQGISTVRKPSFGSYVRSLSAYRSNRYCRAFAEQMGVADLYGSALEDNLRSNLLGAYHRLESLPEADKAEGARLLFETYGTEATTALLAAQFWQNRRRVAPNLQLNRLFPCNKAEIRTVAMFYHRLRGGGAERVTAMLSDILHRNGYRIVVVTNEPPHPEDYPLPEGVCRVTLGDPAEGRHYSDRFRAWQQCIADHSIDAVVYHAWLDDSLLWDMTAIKATGAAFIAYCHTVCTAGLCNGWTGISDTRSTLAYADAMVTLTHSDRLYWSQVCPNVHRTTNPTTFRASRFPAAPLDSHNILWVSRFDYGEKNPEDPLHILQRVRSYVPDATLTMVGEMDERLRSHFETLIRDMGLEGYVTLTGYSTDVAQYYRAAAVHLMTPNFESHSMTISESLANGVPAVTYELPYLRRVKRSRAVVQVPWKDMDTAAEVIAELLTDLDRRREMGALGREEIEAEAQFDFAAFWQEVFRSIEQNAPAPLPADEEAFTELISAFDLVTRQMCHRQMQQQAELTALYNGPTGLRKLLRKIKTALRVLKEKGLKEVLLLAKQKLIG